MQIDDTENKRALRHVGIGLTADFVMSPDDRTSIDTRARRRGVLLQPAALASS